MDFSTLPDITLRSCAVYIFIIVAIRLFGKKEISQISVPDLVFILLISNAVQNAMVGPDNSLLGGLTAAFTLFLLNVTIKYIIFKSKKTRRLIEGEPVLLIHDGKIMQKNLDREKITLDELNAAVREHGVPNSSHVNLAVLEIDGNISIVSDEFKVKTSKKLKAHKVIKTGN